MYSRVYIHILVQCVSARLRCHEDNNKKEGAFYIEFYISMYPPVKNALTEETASFAFNQLCRA